MTPCGTKKSARFFHLGATVRALIFVTVHQPAYRARLSAFLIVSGRARLCHDAASRGGRGRRPPRRWGHGGAQRWWGKDEPLASAQAIAWLSFPLTSYAVAPLFSMTSNLRRWNYILYILYKLYIDTCICRELLLIRSDVIVRSHLHPRYRIIVMRIGYERARAWERQNVGQRSQRKAIRKHDENRWWKSSTTKTVDRQFRVEI